MRAEAIEKIIEENMKDKDVRIIALNFLKRCDQKFLSGYHKKEDYAAAFSYLAYRKLNRAITMGLVAEIYDSDKRTSFRIYKRIKSIFGLKLCVPEKATLFGKACIPQKDLEEIILKLLKKVKTNKGHTEKCLSLASQLKNMPREKIRLAAAIIYLAGKFYPNLKLTQRSLCTLVSITEVTLRNTYKKIIKDLDLKEELENHKLSLFYLEERREKRLQKRRLRRKFQQREFKKKLEKIKEDYKKGKEQNFDAFLTKLDKTIKERNKNDL